MTIGKHCFPISIVEGPNDKKQTKMFSFSRPQPQNHSARLN